MMVITSIPILTPVNRVQFNAVDVTDQDLTTVLSVRKTQSLMQLLMSADVYSTMNGVPPL
jgi:hypothetical protein